MLLACAKIYAQQIGVEQAEKSAEDFLYKLRNEHKPANAKIRMAAHKLSLAYTAQQDGKVQFYVFNDSESGFVVTSGDEKAENILAYSDKGTFDIATANPNLKFWLKGYQRQIAEAAKQGRTPTQKADIISEKAEVPILIKTQWDQDSPFNKAIRTETSKNYPTGCVATALAQVMKYYEWPVSGKGSHYYYDSDGSRRGYTRNFEHNYDWDNMIKSYYNESYTTIQADAVAELMFDTGVATNMAYSLSGSGTFTEQVPYAMVHFFGYDEGISHAYRDYYTNEEWEELIYSELAEGRPVMYGGNDYDEGGHSFICDGYQASTGKYHFNWGWGGDGDCYCALSAVKFYGYNFSYYQDIVYGIQKPCNGKAKLNLILYDENYLESSKTEDGEYATYKLTFGYTEDWDDGFIWNDSHKSSDVLFGMKYVNQKTGKYYYAIPKDTTESKKHFEGLEIKEKQWEDYNGIYSLTLKNVKIPQIPAGKYRVYLVYKEWEDRNDDTVEWEVVKGFLSKKNYIVEILESKLDIPVAQEAIDVTEYGFTASWTAVEGAESYSVSLTSTPKDSEVEMTSEQIGTNTAVFEGIKDTSYTFTELDNNCTYTYKVRVHVGDDASKWSNSVDVALKEIVVPKDTCTAPQISYENGVLSISSSTEDATCYYTLTNTDVKDEFTEAGNEIKLDATYLINAYAAKPGWKNSETVHAMICWLEKIPEQGEDVIAVKSTPVIIQHEGTTWSIRGLPDDIEVSAYTIDGKFIGQATSKNGSAHIPFSTIATDDVVIFKIGDYSIKYYNR